MIRARGDSPPARIFYADIFITAGGPRHRTVQWLPASLPTCSARDKLDRDLTRHALLPSLSDHGPPDDLNMPGGGQPPYNPSPHTVGAIGVINVGANDAC